MKIKVHWIVDGIAELDANNQEEAEKWVNETLTKILNDIVVSSKIFFIPIKFIPSPTPASKTRIFFFSFN